VFKQPSSAAAALSAYYDADYAASEYWDDSVPARQALERLLKAILRVAPPADSTLLDVGCGAGLFLELAKAAGYRVPGWK